MQILSYHFSIFDCFILVICSFIVGLSKAGISSISILTVSGLAYVFGGKSSTGIVLPMLLFADIFAVKYYNRHTDWSMLKRLLPWMVFGVLIGVWFGKDISEILFKKSMAVLIVITVISMIWWEQKPERNVPNHWSFAGVIGLMAGFTTMVGNLAGAFSNIYFLTMRVTKDTFIGTTAWLFLLINAFKIPFHALVWHTITWESLIINLVLLPFLLAGFFVGVQVVKRIDDVRYRKLILYLTGFASIFILLSL
jgi:uncharacterized protein